MSDDDAEQNYRQTCQEQLLLHHSADEDGLVSQADFASFVWVYCCNTTSSINDDYIAGSACNSGTNGTTTTTDDRFESLPLAVRLAFAPTVDDDDAGCAEDAPPMEQLNCIVVAEPRESDNDDDGEIYLKISQHYATLCNNSTFARLLESQLLQKNNETEPSTAEPSSLPSNLPTSSSEPSSMPSGSAHPSGAPSALQSSSLEPSASPSSSLEPIAAPPSTAAPSSLETGGMNSLRPGSSSTTTPPSQKSLSTGTMATVVLFALLIPIAVLALWLWQRQKNTRANKQQQLLLAIFTKQTVEEIDEDPALAEDESVSSENSRAFSPASHNDDPEKDGEDMEDSSSSPKSNWLAPQTSKKPAKQLRVSTKSSEISGWRKISIRKDAAATTTCSSSNNSVRSQATSSTNCSSRRSRNSRDRKASFAYPTELHDSVVSPGNRSWFVSLPRPRSGAAAAVVKPPPTQLLSPNNPVNHRKRFGNKNSDSKKSCKVFAFDETDPQFAEVQPARITDHDPEQAAGVATPPSKQLPNLGPPKEIRETIHRQTADEFNKNNNGIHPLEERDANRLEA